MSSVQNPSLIPLYWLGKTGIPLLDYETIPNILGSVIHKLIINQQGFWTLHKLLQNPLQWSNCFRAFLDHGGWILGHIFFPCGRGGPEWCHCGAGGRAMQQKWIRWFHLMNLPTYLGTTIVGFLGHFSCPCLQLDHLSSRKQLRKIKMFFFFSLSLSLFLVQTRAELSDVLLTLVCWL